jgi:hypothetical protein
MMTVLAEQEHFPVVPDGQHCTVVERRAGRFYPLRNGIRHGLGLNGAGLIRQSGTHSEGRAQSSGSCGDAMARSV